MAPIILVLGGARSGKSRFAEQRLMSFPAAGRIYVATAEAFDTEMRERIALHRQRRGEDWITVEAPHDLGATITARSAPDHPLLVDCLTLWLSNRLLADADLDAETDALVDAVRAARGPLVLVSNEVGLSIVPDNALARRFRDAAGLVNQKIAAIADEVQMVVAGLPLRLR